MRLSEANVKRTWRYDKDHGMCYRMEVDLGPGTEKVYAEFVVSEHCMDARTMSPEAIEHCLERLIVNHIRSSLFPRS